MDEPERLITHHSCATVYRSAAEVARYVLDPMTMPEWSAVIYRVEPPGDGVFRPGGRLRGNMHILGVSLTVEGEMVSYDPVGMRAAIKVRPIDGEPWGPKEGSLEHELWVEDLGDAAVLNFRNRLTLPGWIPPDVVSDGFVRHLLDQASAFALANIKYILETEGGSRVRDFMALAAGHLSGPQPLEEAAP